MVCRQPYRMRGVAQAYIGIYSQWSVRQQSRLRSGNHEAFGRGMHRKVTTVGTEVCAEYCDPGATGNLQPIDPQSRLCTGSGPSTLPTPLQRNALPSEVGARSHGGSFQAIDEIRITPREIDTALRERAQVSRASGGLETLGVARSVEVHLNR